MTTRDDLDDSGLRIERLWRQGAPRQVREMEAAGSFYAHILSLQNQEARTYDRLIGEGRPHDQVMEILNELVAPPLTNQSE